MNTMFEPRRPAEPKGKHGKGIVGIWATQDEKAAIRKLAETRGYQSVADYFRWLIREDIRLNGEPPAEN